MQIVRVVVQNPSFHPQNTSTIDDAGTVQRSFATLRMTRRVKKMIVSCSRRLSAVTVPGSDSRGPRVILSAAKDPSA
jgi:DNA integrity scanning protein DisA with diadenylate cyclase activity